MGKKKKIIIGAVSALVLCLSFGGGYLLSRNGGIEELLEETGLSKKSTKNKDAKKGDTDMDDGIDADAAGEPAAVMPVTGMYPEAWEPTGTRGQTSWTTEAPVWAERVPVRASVSR